MQINKQTKMSKRKCNNITNPNNNITGMRMAKRHFGTDTFPSNQELEIAALPSTSSSSSLASFNSASPSSSQSSSSSSSWTFKSVPHNNYNYDEEVRKHLLLMKMRQADCSDDNAINTVLEKYLVHYADHPTETRNIITSTPNATEVPDPQYSGGFEDAAILMAIERHGLIKCDRGLQMSDDTTPTTTTPSIINHHHVMQREDNNNPACRYDFNILKDDTAIFAAIVSAGLESCL